ncbi:hypothetical protein HF086_008743 [Spodoptera exigua]|uniref:Aldehyde dehydrogenase domain-containing protein n=1 Tax=Spodoptera exigua TaxID=7107 RepID=A0A922MRR9_SPOEX|nr:hypothetical protein HF086_008743 [Spodoptera exigua]
MDASKHGEILRFFSDLMERDFEYLAVLESYNNGMVLSLKLCPVQSILKFNTSEEAIERANATNYGLAAGIFTTDLNTAIQFSKHVLVEADTVWINTYLYLTSHNPFGGFKESGIGHEK